MSCLPFLAMHPTQTDLSHNSKTSEHAQCNFHDRLHWHVQVSVSEDIHRSISTSCTSWSCHPSFSTRHALSTLQSGFLCSHRQRQHLDVNFLWRSAQKLTWTPPAVPSGTLLIRDLADVNTPSLPTHFARKWCQLVVFVNEAQPEGDNIFIIWWGVFSSVSSSQRLEMWGSTQFDAYWSICMFFACAWWWCVCTRWHSFRWCGGHLKKCHSDYEEHTTKNGIRESTGQTSRQTFRAQIPDPMYTQCSAHTILSWSPLLPQNSDWQ